MVVKEDKRLEDFTVAKGHIAVPVDVIFRDGGEIETTVYTFTEQIGIEFEEKFSADPATEEARKFLTERLCPVMKEYGFEPDEWLGEKLYSFRTDVPLDVREETVLLKTNEDISHYTPDTSIWRLEVDDDDEFDVVCAIVKDGHIVSAATANDLYEGDVVEINVETAPKYRNRGYAAAVSAGLASYLIEHTTAGGVVYKCRESNEASYRTALSAGFKLIEQEIPFVFYR